MKVAVTGASGFIGGAVVEQLIGEGHQVVALSCHDLSEPDFTDVDTVIHCAALAHRTGAERPQANEFDAVNHRLTIALAERAKQCGVRRFIFVSTIYTIAGNPSPLTPDMPLSPRDDYGRAKARAEATLLTMTDIEVVIARPVLVYGPDARANLRALMKLCDTALPLPFGAANNRRSFVSLENVARALVFLTTAQSEQVSAKIFHLAEPEPRSTRELVSKAREALGHPQRLIYVPAFTMKTLLTLVSRKMLYEQLFGDMVADTSSLLAIGFKYLPGDAQIAAMAKAVREN